MKLPEWIMFVALIAATGDCLSRKPEQAHATQALATTQAADEFAAREGM